MSFIDSIDLCVLHRQHGWKGGRGLKYLSGVIIGLGFIIIELGFDVIGLGFITIQLSASQPSARFSNRVWE